MTKSMACWKEEYCIGVDQIDAQHKSLVDLINKFNADLDSCDISKLDSFRSAAEMTVKYVQEHFADEEKLMRLHGYPEFEHHKERHAELIRRLLEDTKRFEKGDSFAPMSFLFYLYDWLMRHIAVEDSKIGVFLAAKGGEP